MPLNELLPAIYVPTFAMTVNHVPLPTTVARLILEISVTEHLNPPGQFSFRLNDPTLAFINRADGRFTEGSLVEISLGYVGNLRKMIVGEISALSADFPSSGPATLQVEGFDLLHRATRGTAYRRFEGSTPDTALADSDAVSLIAGELGLTPAVDRTEARREPRVQDHQTNLTFLEELAAANGFFLRMEGATLHFKQRPPQPNRLRLEWHKTLQSFSPRLSTAGHVEAVEVRGWDPIQKQSFSARVERGGAARDALAATGQRQLRQGAGGRSERVLAGIGNTGVASVREARALAERVLADQNQYLVTGNGTSVGQPEMRIGTLLELAGIGRFSGAYEVDQVTHALGDSGYTTSFEVRRQG